MRGATTAEKISYWLFKDRIPFTKAVALINIVTFLILWSGYGKGILDFLGFFSSAALFRPWTFLTYPLVGACGGLICMVFTIYWLWWAGGSLERSWGSRTFAIFFFLTSAISVLGLFIGSMIMSKEASAMGLWLPIAAITVAFGMLNPEQEILFMLFIPLKLKYLAIISAVGVLLGYGVGSPLMGVLALAGCAAAYWYVRNGSRLQFSTTRGPDLGQVIHIRPSHARKRSINPLSWYKDYRDRKRLKDLFKKSGLDD